MIKNFHLSTEKLENKPSHTVFIHSFISILATTIRLATDYVQRCTKASKQTNIHKEEMRENRKNQSNCRNNWSKSTGFYFFYDMFFFLWVSFSHCTEAQHYTVRDAAHYYYYELKFPHASRNHSIIPWYFYGFYNVQSKLTETEGKVTT